MQFCFNIKLIYHNAINQAANVFGILNENSIINSLQRVHVCVFGRMNATEKCGGGGGGKVQHLFDTFIKLNEDRN